MKKLLKLENDTISIKVTGRDYPEVFVYGDKFYKEPKFTGSIDKVSAVLSGYLSIVLEKMKTQKKQFLQLKFDFCEEDYKELQGYEKIEVQTELFED